MKRRQFLKNAAAAAPVMVVPMAFMANFKQDDTAYEEGTFTPTLYGDGDYENLQGVYHRVGNHVYFSAVVQIK